MPRTKEIQEQEESQAAAALDEEISRLKARLEELQRQNEQKEVELKQVTKQLEKLKADQSGWLVTAPNIFYDGTTMGVQFSNGQAFIPDSREFPDYVIKPMKPTELMKYPPEERAQILERQKIPSSQRVAMILQNDFGYHVEHFDGTEERLKEIIDARAKERARLQDMLDKLNAGSASADNVIMPDRFGVVKG